MFKFYCSLTALLLIYVSTTAQSKRFRPSCQPEGLEWRQLGGHLNMIYNGEWLRIYLTAQLPDTHSLARKFIKDRGDGIGFGFIMGKMRIGDKEIKIWLSSNHINYEIHDHAVQFKVYADDIPYVVSEDQTFDILMINFCPDSAVFVCTGKEYIKKVRPAPGVFTNKHAKWVATNSNRDKRHCEFVVALSGTDKGAFGFSLLSLQELNRTMLRGWDDVTWHLLTVASFWFLWYLLVAGRGYFEKIDAKLIRCVVKWLPWMTGFYFVLIADQVTACCKASASLNWRIGFTTTAVLLLAFQLCWRERAATPRVLLVKTLCRTFAYSILVFVFLGAAIQVADRFLGEKNPFSGIGGFLRLTVSAGYAVWAIAACYLYITFVCVKLLAFNRKLQVMLILLVLLFAPWERYVVLSEDKVERFDCGFSIGYPVKKLGETDVGSLGLGISFANQANLFFYIPFIIAIYLVAQVARRKDKQKMTVLMVPFFAFFYCCYLTNIRETFLLLPVTLLTAILYIRPLILQDWRSRLQLIHTGNQLYTQELIDMNVFRKMPEIRQSEKLKNIYRQRLLKGELLPEDYEKAVADLDKLVGDPGRQRIGRRMEFGPFQESFRNGLSGLGYGTLVAGIIYTIYFKLYLVEPHYELYGIPYALSGKIVSLIIQHLAPVIFHGITGFCLGYFFPFLDGKSGWEKGCWLGTALGITHLPFIYFTVGYIGWELLVGIFFKHVIILMLTGFLAFDLVTIRKIYGPKHSWKEMVDVMGWKKTLVLGSFMLAALGSGVTSFISGNVEEVLKKLLG